MKLKTRFSILAFLIVVFVIVAPIIVFFALGYRWDSQNNRLAPTGTLLVASLPRSAVVTLNNKATHSTPATIRLLVPGEYDVTFTKDGYESQTRRVTIFEKRVSNVRENNRPVALFLQQKNPQLVATSTAALAQLDQLVSVSTSEYIYTIEAGTLSRSNRNLTDTQILTANLPEFTNFEILESPKGQLFVLLDNTLYTYSENELMLAATGVENGRWSSNGNFFTYKSRNTIWLYDTIRGTYELITRTTASLKDTVYDNEAHHIIYASGTEIHSVEADHNASRASIRVLNTGTEIVTLALSKDSKTLYYFTEEEELYSLLLR